MIYEFQFFFQFVVNKYTYWLNGNLVDPEGPWRGAMAIGGQCVYPSENCTLHVWTAPYKVYHMLRLRFDPLSKYGSRLLAL